MREQLARRRDLLRSLRRASDLVDMHAWPRERLDRYRDQRLRALVHHAREHSPFHAARLRGIDLDAPGLLQRLPPMNKHQMMSDLPGVLTDPRLRDIDLGAHLEGLTDDALLLGRYRVMATGGTSGVRGLFVYDRAGWIDVVGILAGGPKLLGVPPRLPRPRIATIWASGPAHMTARLASSFSTPVYRRLQLAATLPIADMVSELNRFCPVWLSPYPSIAALLAEEQLAGRLNIAPRVVLVSSEQCTPAMRARIKAAWGVEPYDAYATTESATIAVECEHHRGLHMFEGQVILEVLDADGRPVPDGTQGAKILITNLFNYVQPLIRYELTDLVTIATGSCPCGRTTRRIKSIQGRSDDIMTLTGPDGRQVPVHPNHFAEAIEEIAGIHAYQVTQQAHEIEITIVAPDRDDADITATVAAGVRHRLAPHNVAHTPLRVHVVDTIARPDSASGKFKLVQARPLAPRQPRGGEPAARPRSRSG